MKNLHLARKELSNAAVGRARVKHMAHMATPATHEQALRLLARAFLGAPKDKLCEMWGFGESQWDCCKDMRKQYKHDDEEAIRAVETKLKKKPKFRKILDRRSNPDNWQLLAGMVAETERVERTASAILNDEDEEGWHVIPPGLDMDCQKDKKDAGRNCCAQPTSPLRYASVAANPIPVNPIPVNPVPIVASVPQFQQFYQQQVPRVAMNPALHGLSTVSTVPGATPMMPAMSNGQACATSRRGMQHKQDLVDCHIGKLMQGSAFRRVYVPAVGVDKGTKLSSPTSSRSQSPPSPPSLVDEVYEEMPQLPLKDQQLVHDLVMRLRRQ